MNQYTAEINQLKKALVENNSQLIAMEAACIRETDRHVELEDSLIAWQDKYERLHESHKRVQKINQSLEDKLLKLVDQNASERAQLTSDVATLSVRLAQANYNIGTLQREIVSSKSQTHQIGFHDWNHFSYLCLSFEIPIPNPNQIGTL